ncbi:hypothetical protein SD80_023085 [Scytonema tolypothrichoides VB-61278]|nr:hypothetical protein SD80_023085 [Scytonema tolypothrichoides VB-61278]
MHSPSCHRCLRAAVSPTKPITTLFYTTDFSGVIFLRWSSALTRSISATGVLDFMMIIIGSQFSLNIASNRVAD